MNARMLAWKFVTASLFGRLESSETLHADLSDPPPSFWPNVVTLADARLVTPAVWLGVRGTTWEFSLPAEAVRYLSAVYFFNKDRNERLLRQLDEALAALNSRDIVPAVLKGAAHLKLNSYGDPGARILTDLDILVPMHQLHAASLALFEIGYRETPGASGCCHHLTPLIRSGERAAIELHRKAVGSRAEAALPITAVWQKATLAESRSVRFRLLSPYHSILHCFAHAQLADRHDGIYKISLRALRDLVALDKHYACSLDWRRLLAEARARGFEAEFERFLYQAGRIASFKPENQAHSGVRDRVYFSTCEAAIRWPWLGPFFSRIHQLSRHELVRRYGGPAGFWLTNIYRLRRLTHFITERMRS